MPPPSDSPPGHDPPEGTATPQAQPAEHDLHALVGDIVVETVDIAALYQQYGRGIRSFLYHRVGGQLQIADDLLQKTFENACRARGRVQPGNHRAWFYRIAANVANDYWGERSTISLETWTLQGGNKHLCVVPFEDYAGAEELVKQALAALSPREQTCFLLRSAGGFSALEVADILGISGASVDAYVSRGREKFRVAWRRLLDESGSTMTPNELVRALEHAVEEELTFHERASGLQRERG